MSRRPLKSETCKQNWGGDDLDRRMKHWIFSIGGKDKHIPVRRGSIVRGVGGLGTVYGMVCLNWLSTLWCCGIFYISWLQTIKFVHRKLIPPLFPTLTFFFLILVFLSMDNLERTFKEALINLASFGSIPASKVEEADAVIDAIRTLHWPRRPPMMCWMRPVMMKNLILVRKTWTKNTKA